MKIIEVAAGFGTTFNDPYENFRNHRPTVMLKASVEGDEFSADVIRNLAKMAREAVEAERSLILDKRMREERTCDICHKVDPDTYEVRYVHRAPAEQGKQTRLCGSCASKVQGDGLLPF